MTDKTTTPVPDTPRRKKKVEPVETAMGDGMAVNTPPEAVMPDTPAPNLPDAVGGLPDIVYPYVSMTL